jgi:hypothetical protein
MLPAIAPEHWQLFERAVDQILSGRPARSNKQTRTAQRSGKSTAVKAKSNPLKPLGKRSGKLMTKKKAASKPLRSARKQGGKSMPVKAQSKRQSLQRKQRGKLR